jgi:signal transduction histidine kinase
VANAQRNIQRLRLLTDAFLAQSQLHANALQLECKELDLRTVVADAVEAVHLLNLRKDQVVEIDLPEPLPVMGDAHRLEQVLVNLLANATTHTPRGTRVSIMGWVEDGTVHLVVRDDGPGLRAEELERIFQPFSRGESPSGGTGLGLAIARELGTLHGGRLWAESVPGEGAAFHVTLPLAHQGASS